MGRIEKQIRIPSIKITKGFLRDLQKTIFQVNSKKMKSTVEIISGDAEEKITYDHLEDFLGSIYLPKYLKSFLIRFDPLKKSEKKSTTRMYLFVEGDKKHSYYKLLSYDEGKLLKCQKIIEKIILDHKNWYNFLFKFDFIKEWLSIFASFGLAFIIYKIFLIGSFNLLVNISFIIAAILFFIFKNQGDSILNKLFPYIEVETKKSEKKTLIKSFLLAVLAGLTVTALVKIISILISELK